MTDRTVAKRYAKALYDIGTEQGKSEIFAENINEIAALLEENQEIGLMLLNQSIQSADKKKAMGLIIEGVDGMVKNFVNLVIDKNRADSLVAMCASYKELMEEQANVARAEIVSAVPLTEEQVKKIEDKFSGIVGQTVKAETSVDASLIGGVQVRIGDTVYDGSLANQLKKLNDSLKQTVL
ncbi:MAG: ATP synthase F1 subunit delta [Firmicutes bacterium]|nr:ATP synthase F1 subunit delta [Bacillota bacterium]MBQ6811227.1 ATP synthase F1 subunit delta [Bacillota bacterium]